VYERLPLSRIFFLSIRLLPLLFSLSLFCSCENMQDERKTQAKADESEKGEKADRWQSSAAIKLSSGMKMSRASNSASSAGIVA